MLIKCYEADEQVHKLKRHIEAFDSRLQGRLDGKIYFICHDDILYFESVDNRTFIYTADNVYETQLRLYELEEAVSRKDFLRISKSQIANINKITALKPEINRTVTAELTNGERLSISRKYVKALRSLLEI